MAYATELTINTGNKVSLNYQSHEVSVSITYQLERDDSDIIAVVKEKTAELAQAHRAAWQTLRDTKVAAAKARQTNSELSSPEVEPKAPPETSLEASPKPTHEEPVAEVTPQEILVSATPPEPPASETPNGVEQLQTTALPELQMESAEPPTDTPSVPPVTPGQVAALSLLLRQAGWNDEHRAEYLRDRFSCDSLDTLNAEQARQWLLELQRAEREALQQRRLENAYRNGTP